MDYQTKIKSFLSTCSGRVMNVYYELYTIVDSLEDSNQAAAIQYICENYYEFENDSSYEIKKDYYSDKQLEQISRKFTKIDLNGLIESLANESSQKGVSPDEFYSILWNTIKKKFKTKRELALALSVITKNELIPYRAVGIGLSMTDEEYKELKDYKFMFWFSLK